MQDFIPALIQTANEQSQEPTSRVLRREPLPLGKGRKSGVGPHPAVAVLLAVLVGLIVFLIIWRMRKTFGMKE
jgi:hypothetical protein